MTSLPYSPAQSKHLSNKTAPDTAPSESESNTGVKMAYARVVNIEYKVPERLEAAIKNWTEEGF